MTPYEIFVALGSPGETYSIWSTDRLNEFFIERGGRKQAGLDWVGSRRWFMAEAGREREYRAWLRAKYPGVAEKV